MTCLPDGSGFGACTEGGTATGTCTYGYGYNNDPGWVGDCSGKVC